MLNTAKRLATQAEIKFQISVDTFPGFHAKK
jgi:hypothetical protein